MRFDVVAQSIVVTNGVQSIEERHVRNFPDGNGALGYANCLNQMSSKHGLEVAYVKVASAPPGPEGAF